MKFQLKFDGKTYHEDSAHNTKTDAKRRAKVLREKGTAARVVFYAGMWMVFKR